MNLNEIIFDMVKATWDNSALIAKTQVFPSLQKFRLTPLTADIMSKQSHIFTVISDFAMISFHISWLRWDYLSKTEDRGQFVFHYHLRISLTADTLVIDRRATREMVKPTLVTALSPGTRVTGSWVGVILLGGGLPILLICLPWVAWSDSGFPESLTLVSALWSYLERNETSCKLTGW